eukprot:9467426-Pyramimonas_sp.AAC.1
MERGIVHSIQWCDTRDVTADGHTKGRLTWEVYDPSNVTYRVILPIGLARHLVLWPPEEYLYAQSST